VTELRIIARAVLSEYDHDEQLNMMTEEAAELIAAINKWRRGRIPDSEIISEIADVAFMAIQIAESFDINSVEVELLKKARRQLVRMPLGYNKINALNETGHKTSCDLLSGSSACSCGRWML